MLEDCSRLMKVLRCSGKELLLTCRHHHSFLMTEVIVTNCRWRLKLSEGTEAMLIANMLVIELLQWQWNPIRLVEARERFVIATAHILQRLSEHALAHIRFHLFLLQLGLFLTFREIFKLLTGTFLLEEEVVCSCQC